ncbi:hypothetical protein B0J12DRAFT_594846 [Macrophomina phaseolina]|uniref:Succinate dehydrogenase/Fumarate reductase transmembrane subunit n=1 Tax=Macrophomina phaseolina TaxID=35725 RepID=A0ABQ8GKR7_9PEZI|nr:hypothetical protein B0J12DRAFT_594846 [Macrophomina phaseolina]
MKGRVTSRRIHDSPKDVSTTPHASLTYSFLSRIPLPSGFALRLIGSQSRVKPLSPELCDHPPKHPSSDSHLASLSTQTPDLDSSSSRQDTHQLSNAPPKHPQTPCTPCCVSSTPRHFYYHHFHHLEVRLPLATHSPNTSHVLSQNPHPRHHHPPPFRKRPHLSIYRPQHTWFNPSILGRITGSLLSGGLYLFFAAYACAPLLGWDFSSQNVVVVVVAAAAALPAAATVGAKSLLGFAGSFHCANGVRHLVWDCGKRLNNVAARRSGWVVLGVSVCGAVAGAMW